MREYGEFLLPPIFCITYTIFIKYYLGESVNISIQSIINIMQEKNWVTTIKNGKIKLPLFYGNGEEVIPIYALWDRIWETRKTRSSLAGIGEDGGLYIKTNFESI